MPRPNDARISIPELQLAVPTVEYLVRGSLKLQGSGYLTLSRPITKVITMFLSSSGLLLGLRDPNEIMGDRVRPRNSFG
jgi:hypothetical protein